MGGASGTEAFHPMAGGLRLDGLGFEGLVGLRDVNGFDVLQVVAACGIDAVGHGGDDPVVDKLLYPTGIAEVGLHVLVDDIG